MKDVALQAANIGKFQNSTRTADGSIRASVALSHPETLWFNTGTLCNITCTNCYIKSSPSNDALVYLNTDEVTDYLDQITARDWPVREIGFTGGEPFMNPQIIAMARAALTAGFEVLILTNAMAPMMRPNMRAGLLDLQAEYGDRLTLRVSIDHYTARRHDAERGTGSFDKTLQGMTWLRDAGIRMTVAGRIEWAESEAEARAGFAAFFAGFLLIMLPQFYCWYQLNGMPFPPRHMKFAGEGLSGFSPLDYLQNLSSLLWSPKWGLILSMPLAQIGRAHV